MSIPKIVYQTYKTKKIPLITKWHRYRMQRKNPGYKFLFYDDNDIDTFIKENFDSEVYELFLKIQIGAAKADFFRYAILYKYGGIYLDIDSKINDSIDSWIFENDVAVIAKEKNNIYYTQWALFYEANHPFLEATLDRVLDNIANNRFPYDTHKMTGPTAYLEGIESCLKKNPAVKYRMINSDYDSHCTFSYPASKFFLYGFSRKNHWKKDKRPILR
jgi:inositol phosphorylceramide mannosyltransferase catalytic subunit